jgi:hypothetical protein
VALSQASVAAVEMDHELGPDMEEPTILQCILDFVLHLFCRCRLSDSEREHAHVPREDTQFPSNRARRPVRSRPLQDVAESSSLLQSDTGGDFCHLNRLSPQERQFKAMKKPSFSTAVFKGKSVDEESCLICLEEFTEENPRIHLACGHGFHLGCMLEWQERGKTWCPVCDITVGSLDDS